MYVNYNQFNFATMNFNHTPNAISIFSNGKSSAQVATQHTSNNKGDSHLDQFLEQDNDLYHLTQDDRSAASSQSSKEIDPKQRNLKESSLRKRPTQLKHPKTDKRNSSDSEDSAEKNSKNSSNFNAQPQPGEYSTTAHAAGTTIITPQRRIIAPNTQLRLTSDRPSKIYSSPFLAEEFKPSADTLNLPPELELLRPVILSQHEVFIQPIKELGNINLFLTKIIEKKKESLHQLKNNNKIPRSLRIKCELTTSELYTDNEEFIQAKEELHEIISSCIKNGTRVMINWAETNIKLLTIDRCASILEKAIPILDDLISFFAEIIGMPRFLSLPSDKCMNLFLFKLYMSDQYIDVKYLADYFELPLDKILSIGAKIISQAPNEDEANSMVRAVNLNDINPDNEVHERFLSEVLTSFHQILSTSTIDIWKAHNEKSKLATAAQNLKAKRKASEILDATAATATAITRAEDSLSRARFQGAHSNLRLSNLEKSFRKQEQKTNEILNSFSTKNKQPQKNSKGSGITGSAASPERKILFRNENRFNQKIIDLSKEDPSEILETSPEPKFQHNKSGHTKRKQKTQRNMNPTFSERKGKTVHWNEEELQSFQEQHPDKQSTFSTLQAHNLPTQNGFMGYQTPTQATPPSFHPSSFPPAIIPAMQQLQGSFPNTFPLQTHHIFHPGFPQQWQQPQWNVAQNPFGTQTPFGNQTQFKGTATKENPFGTQR
jgi:hypothetical protein